MLVPLGVQTTCLLNFKAQFKQTNGKYSIYTPEGLVKSSTAYQSLNIHDIQVIGSLERDDVTKPSLYQYDDIIKWNDIISFSTKKSTLLHVLSQDIDIAKASSSSRKISSIILEAQQSYSSLLSRPLRNTAAIQLPCSRLVPLRYWVTTLYFT